jgi:hypothetical protein
MVGIVCKMLPPSHWRYQIESADVIAGCAHLEDRLNLSRQYGRSRTLLVPSANSFDPPIAGNRKAPAN